MPKRKPKARRSSYFDFLRDMLIKAWPHLRSLVASLTKRIPEKLLISIGFIVLAAGVLLWLVSVSSTRDGFPLLEAGKYVGVLDLPHTLAQGTGGTGNSATTERKRLTLYVESKPEKNALIAVIFEQDWRPTLLPLFFHDGVTQEDKPESFKALQVPFHNRTLELIGTRSGTQFVGTVSESGAPQVVGSWLLRPLTESEDRRREFFGLEPNWLTLKGTHRLRQEELAEIEEKNRHLTERIQTLQHFAQTPDALAHIRASYAQTLENELEKLRQEQETYASRITALVRELNQLERITLYGRVTSLARRVSAREDRWYGVNWADAQTAEADEQRVAEEMGVNMRTVHQQLLAAREIQNLRSQIAAEKASIRKLSKEFQRKKEEGLRRQTPPPPSSPTPRTPDRDDRDDQKKPWWQRWDTVFGAILAR